MNQAGNTKVVLRLNCLMCDRFPSSTLTLLSPTLVLEMNKHCNGRHPYIGAGHGHTWSSTSLSMGLCIIARANKTKTYAGKKKTPQEYSYKKIIQQRKFKWIWYPSARVSIPSVPSLTSPVPYDHYDRRNPVSPKKSKILGQVFVGLRNELYTTAAPVCCFSLRRLW